MEEMSLLGALILAFWSAQQFTTTWGELFNPIRLKLRQRYSNQKNLWDLLWSRFLISLLESDWKSANESAEKNFNEFPEQKRSSLLEIAFAVFAFFPLFLIVLGFLRLEGLALVGFSLIFILMGSLKTKNSWGLFISHVGKLILLYGLTLISLQLMVQNWGLKSSSDFFNSPEGSSLAFLLADGRGPGLLILIATSFVLSFVFPWMAWSVLLGLGLSLNMRLSLNGAVALFFGEMLSRCFQLAWKSRCHLRQSSSLFGIWGRGLQMLGLFLGFVWFGFQREGLEPQDWGFSNLIDAKIFTLSLSWVFVLTPFFVLSMIWGHWAARPKSSSSSK